MARSNPCELNGPIIERFIEELDLTVRSYDCLSRAGIRTIGDLTRKTEQDLHRIGNFGRRSLGEIKSVLSSLGLTLRLKPPKPRREVYAERNAIIRASQEPDRVLAERFGVSRSRIDQIRNRERYNERTLLQRCLTLSHTARSDNAAQHDGGISLRCPLAPTPRSPHAPHQHRLGVLQLRDALANHTT